MRRFMAKVFMPCCLIMFWIWFCFSVCRTTSMECNGLYFWLMLGFPFGIRRMWMVLIPRNYGLAGTAGVIAFDCIVGGLIGVIVLLMDLLAIAFTAVQIMIGR